MKYYTNKMVRDFIKCPQFGDIEYGKWGGLRLEVRQTIKRLLDVNESADYIIKSKQKEINRLNSEYRKVKSKEKLLTSYRSEINRLYDQIIEYICNITYVKKEIVIKKYNENYFNALDNIICRTINELLLRERYTAYKIKLKNDKKVKICLLGNQLKEILDSYNIDYEIVGDDRNDS